MLDKHLCQAADSAGEPADQPCRWCRYARLLAFIQEAGAGEVESPEADGGAVEAVGEVLAEERPECVAVEGRLEGCEAELDGEDG